MKVNDEPKTRHLFCVAAKNSKPGDSEIFFHIFILCYGCLAWGTKQKCPVIVELTVYSFSRVSVQQWRALHKKSSTTL